MKNGFVITQNVLGFSEMMESHGTVRGAGHPGFSVVVGRAGRGKSECARWYAVSNPSSVVYVSYIGTWTPLSMLQAICWELCQCKPGRATQAVELITEEMSRERKAVIVDEADRMGMKLLDLLRDLNELTGCPIVLVGEEPLTGKLKPARRVCSRVRRRMEFLPVQQADLAQFYAQAMEGVTLDPQALTLLTKACEGDFRPAIVDAYAVERLLRANRGKEINADLARAAVAMRKGDGDE